MRLLPGLLAILIALTLLPASVRAEDDAEAFAWRSFEACLAISQGASLDTAAQDAGYEKDPEGWFVRRAERAFTIELKPIPNAPNRRTCIVVIRGPLPEHDRFARSIADWASTNAFFSFELPPSPGGGQTLQYVTRDNSRIVSVAWYPEGNEAQPTRSALFFGWTTN